MPTVLEYLVNLKDYERETRKLVESDGKLLHLPEEVLPPFLSGCAALFGHNNHQISTRRTSSFDGPCSHDEPLVENIIAECYSLSHNTRGRDFFMLITTFNVNSVRTRLPILTRWLADNHPDFLFMQETKTQDSSFPASAFSALGYRSFFCGEKSYNGVAVLVKGDLDVQVSFGFDEGDYSTRVLTLRHKALTVLNTYVPQGKELSSPSYTEKKAFLARVKNIAAREKSGLFLWLGDMNVAPAPGDVKHPEDKKNHVCFTQEIRDIFADTSSGLVDLLRKFHKEDEVFTFYDYRVKDALARGIGWRIDHMLASPSLAEKAQDCSPDVAPRTWEKPSDHVPLTAKFTEAYI